MEYVTKTSQYFTSGNCSVQRFLGLFLHGFIQDSWKWFWIWWNYIAGTLVVFGIKIWLGKCDTKQFWKKKWKFASETAHPQMFRKLKCKSRMICNKSKLCEHKTRLDNLTKQICWKTTFHFVNSQMQMFSLNNVNFRLDKAKMSASMKRIFCNDIFFVWKWIAEVETG